MIIRRHYMGRNISSTGEYVEYLLDVIDLVASNNRRPILADYERAVANFLNSRRPLSGKLYTSRDVHTQVRRAMHHLLQVGKAIQIGRYFYPAMENQHFKYELLYKHVHLSKPVIHVISSTSYALAIEAGQDISELKSAITEFLDPKNLFGVFIQDDIMLLLVDPEIPKEIIAHLTQAVRDAYYEQHPSSKIST
jgi:hypothetical protein